MNVFKRTPHHTLYYEFINAKTIARQGGDPGVFGNVMKASMINIDGISSVLEYATEGCDCAVLAYCIVQAPFIVALSDALSRTIC